jgi:phospholipid/cholesterol/gamma-HCH transport system substrate-binding protein
MRRLLSIIVAGGALSAFVFLALGAGGHEKGSPSYWVELDNAFGLVNGADLKIAGVRAGAITDMKVDMHSHRALIGIRVDGNKGDFNSLRTDAFCESKPQSLIGEYFVDCQPGRAATKLKPGSRISVGHTASTIPADLVQNVLRLPYRERLRLIVNELGTAVAGREGDLNAAIRRASPALRETDKVLAILAQENNVIRDLTTNADTVITALSNNRADVGRWVVAARRTAEASASRNVDLAGTFAKLPGFLEELRPTMAALGRVADEQTPALRDLNATSGQLTRFFKDLGPFANASRPSFSSLGQASQVGDQAVKSANQSGTIRLLKNFASSTPEVGKNLGIILADLDNPARAVESDPRAAKATGRPAPTGYSGLEALLQYVYDQEQATNVFDNNGYILKISVFGGECAPYRNADTLNNPNPVSPQPGAPTGPQLLKDCGAHLGPTQPGLNSADPTARAASSARERSTAGASAGTQDSNAAATPAPSAPAAPSGGSGGAHKPQLPIDVQKTLDQLLGHVPGLPKVPGVQLPQSVTNQINNAPNTPLSKQDTQALLNYLLAP